MKKDASGRRSVEVEFELPGTPEQVWEAIATGPGISSWFVPAEVETRVGGAVAFHLGPGMESSGHVTVWEPPHRFAYEEPGWSGDAQPLASEFIVEARQGGTCTVRIVHSLFASNDDWDDQIESMETGWRAFFGVLSLYLAHFPGMRSASIRPTGRHPGSHDAAWEAVKDALGLSAAAAGQERDTSVNGGPRLVGTVERVAESPSHREVMLRLEQPAPGVALIGTYVWGDRVQVAISLYFYGDDADATAARESPTWQAWIDEHFKPSEAPGHAGSTGSPA
jgi:uncharacterized protein YndB with AHSA1/START domain